MPTMVGHSGQEGGAEGVDTRVETHAVVAGMSHKTNGQNRDKEPPTPYKK